MKSRATQTCSLLRLIERYSHPTIALSVLTNQSFFAGYPGFEAFDSRGKSRIIMLDMINKRLTQSLGKESPWVA